MSRDVRDVIVDHCMGRVPVSFGRNPAFINKIILKLDKEEGRVPLKPLPWMSRILRFVRLLKTSNGPLRLGMFVNLRSVNDVKVDQLRGMVLVLRLAIDCA